MAPKKKKVEQPGPIEQALKAQNQTAKTAQRKVSQSIALPMEQTPFYAQQVKHRFGTCWQCGTARETAGGLPNTGDAFWCARCKCYLPVRHDRKDVAKLPLIIGKK